MKTPEGAPVGARLGTLVSVNVGTPRDVPWNGTTVHTGVYKDPVAGPRVVQRLNVDGDGQGDLGGHGGEQRAVMVYQQQSYDYWSTELSRDDLTPGNFGENFTVDGLPDDEVCIGDRYRIGDALFEVTQPRVTCYRVGLRLGVPEMAALLVSHRRPGFYLRVIEEGTVASGDPIVKAADGRHRLTVAAVDALLYLPGRSHDLLRLAVDVPALSPGWQQSFHDLLQAADAGDEAPTPDSKAEPAWRGFRSFTVTRTVHETPSVLSLYLSDAAGGAVPKSIPGQYLTVRVPADGAPAIRSYSISGQPDDFTYRISVKREPLGLVSRRIDDDLAPGSVIDVAAPRGDFVLSRDDGPVLLISAGIGITPVLAMLTSIAAESPNRAVWWLHVARTAADYALASEADDLLQKLPAAQSRIYLTRAAPSDDATTPGTVRGHLDVDRLRELHLDAEANAYVCGPSGFITATTQALVDLGFAPGRIHSELFTALAAFRPGVAAENAVPAHQPDGPAGTGPNVTFTRSGLSVKWSGRFGSLLEFAEACDVPARWSCRTGVCHTCITGLLMGEVTYSPEPLERPDQSQVLLCCAQPSDEIVLDA